MRCKCGFNSFDHNLVCPKCHKDLTASHRLLNLEIPAPGGVNFFQIVGQRAATPPPAPPDEGLIEIEVTGNIEADQPGGLALEEVTITPLDPMPSHQEATPDGSGGDDFSFLVDVDSVNLAALEEEL